MPPLSFFFVVVHVCLFSPHFPSVCHIKKAHQKLIIITDCVTKMYVTYKLEKHKKNAIHLNIRYHSVIYIKMKEVYMIYTSCKIHVAHTYHTIFVLPNALKSKKMQKCCVPSRIHHTNLTMLVTVCLCL